MKKLIHLILLVSFCLLWGCSESSAESEPDGNGDNKDQVVITLNMPGTLENNIPNESFSRIKINGRINGTDIRCLRGIIPYLTHIDLGDATIVAGGDAYYNITHKTEDNVVGRFMFSKLTGAFEIVLPKNAISMKQDAFAESSGLISVVLPPNITEIEQETFLNCTSLAKIKIGSTVKNIGFNAFCGCSSLKDVKFEGSDIQFDSQCFAKCYALTEIALPNNLKIIPGNTFSDTGLTSIIIPNSVHTIESDAFQNCTALRKVKIGSGLKVIHPWAFNNTNNIEDISIDMNNPYLLLDEGIIYSKDIKTIYLDTKVADVTHLIIRDGVETISEEAFYQSFFTKVTIPSSVKNIKQGAFAYKVNEVHCQSKTPPQILWWYSVGNYHQSLYAFGAKSSTNANLYVPKGCVEAYKSAEGYNYCFGSNIFEE